MLGGKCVFYNEIKTLQFVQEIKQQIPNSDQSSKYTEHQTQQ